MYVHCRNCQGGEEVGSGGSEGTYPSSARCPVLVILGPALHRALLLHDIFGEDGGGDKVVDPLLPPRGERGGARELQAGVGVVAQGVPLAPRPQVPVVKMVNASCVKSQLTAITTREVTAGSAAKATAKEEATAGTAVEIAATISSLTTAAAAAVTITATAEEEATAGAGPAGATTTEDNQQPPLLLLQKFRKQQSSNNKQVKNDTETVQEAKQQQIKKKRLKTKEIFPTS